MKFKIISEFKPKGDQPDAINEIVKSFNHNCTNIVLKGVTGSGKTFTMANVIEKLNTPTLVLAHNKTLAAQLYSEFKTFFPKNAVEYFVSYYDYYQPEAYMPITGTYIEKDLSINEEIEKLRLSTTSTLLSGRKDVIVIASVSCLYGIGNPVEFKKNTIEIKCNQVLSRTKFMYTLVQSLYSRSNDEFKRGTFRVKGDIIDLFPSYSDIAYKINFFGDEIEKIESFDPINFNSIENLKKLTIYPSNIFVTTPHSIENAIKEIQNDLVKQVDHFKNIGKNLESKRILERTEFDMEMMKELGYCSGIENYSRYFDGRKPGTRPFCLLDYFPDDYLTIIDESHVTLPQVRAMYGGDRSRKENLVEYGFRLPAAMDNRPLKFEEFELLQNNVIYVSATPADYELEMSEGIIIEQIIRPTGLLDPKIKIKSTKHQIDDLINEIQLRIVKKEKILVTTLTKKMAEELTSFLTKIEIRSKYIHSDVDTLERVKIMQGLREDKFDVLIGVNLLREGLDLPEVSLVAILDADKEGFLRSHRSLTQTVGRAARHINGIAILYADKMTKSIIKTMEETNYRRAKQSEYNKINNITPKPVVKSIENPLTEKLMKNKSETEGNTIIDFVIPKKSKDFNKKIRELRKLMEKSAKELDFKSAALYRDQIKKMKELKLSSS